jgi:hypothetical protein
LPFVCRTKESAALVLFPVSAWSVVLGGGIAFVPVDPDEPKWPVTPHEATINTTYVPVRGIATRLSVEGGGNRVIEKQFFVRSSRRRNLP